MPPESPAHFDVVVIGAGAAGMMCALTAGQRGRRTLLLERNERVGKKIAISGGGRCNFTNIHAGPENYLSANPDFCRSALARYSPQDFIALVEKHGIAYYEKKLGQQFCHRSSREVIAMLIEECCAAGVETRCRCQVSDIRKSDRFHLATTLGDISCDSLVIATGGLSFSNLGATDFGYRVATQFGLRITELRPGLVPLTFAPDDRARFQQLSGLSLPVAVRQRGVRFEEAMLLTHRGMSGPVILQISSFWRENETLTFDLLPDIQDPDWLFSERSAHSSLSAALARHWPRRFAEAWCGRHASQKPFAHYSHQDMRELDHMLHHWPVRFSGTEGYPKAEVTLGGVDTGNLSSKTMEARHVRGLFFIGEVVDVTGWLGGYNFQWAWASGYAAGLVV
jgi:predicted Rossmann fold flavoprotein